jgi:membrane-bound lytic murein transglycosylase B
VDVVFDGLEPFPPPPPPPPPPRRPEGEAPPAAPTGPPPRVDKVDAYLKKIVCRERVERGAEMLNAHRALLGEVEREYGVPAEIIVAIWGIESSFGGFMGNTDAIRALATLGWETRAKDDYFRNEFIEAVRIIDKGHAKHGGLVGSWDGGLGQCQFMPSNFHVYAVDKDGDGVADIWNSLPDVFASMGNFISSYCDWDSKVRAAGYKVTVPAVGELPADVIGGYWGERKEARPGRYYLWNGVKPTHRETRLPLGQETHLLMPDGDDGPTAFLATRNFKAIMRYNPSTQYAMAVSTLAQEIVDEAAALRRAGGGK